MKTKKIDIRLRAAILVKVVLLVALIWYGIKSKRKLGYYLLSIFVIGPAAAWAVFAVSGPILRDEEASETK